MMSSKQDGPSGCKYKIHIEGNDRIVRLILRSKKRGFVILMICILTIVLLPVLWAVKESNFTNRALPIDALRDYGYWNSFLLLLPFLTWFMRYYFGGLEDALWKLKEREVVEKSDEEFKKFGKEATKLFKRRWVTWSPYLFGAVITVVGYLTYLGAGRGTWNSPVTNPFANFIVWLSIPPIFILYLVLGQFVARVACLWSVINLFMQEERTVHINPLHPDGAGGLEPLGSFSFRILPACLVGGISTLIGLLTNIHQYNLPAFHPTILLMLVGYVFALTIVFFLPLFAARGQMKRAKSAMLERIGQKCNTLVCDAITDLEGPNDPEDEKIKVQNRRMKLRLESIENVNKLYEVADRMPIYPFNAKTIFGFTSSVLWPALLWVLQEGYSILKAHNHW